MANGDEFKVGERVCFNDYPGFSYLCGTVSEVEGDDVTFVENEGDAASEASWTFQRGDLLSADTYYKWEEIRLEILVSNWCQNHEKWSMPSLFIDKKPSLCEKYKARSEPTVTMIKPTIKDNLKNIFEEIYLSEINIYNIKKY